MHLLVEILSNSYILRLAHSIALGGLYLCTCSITGIEITINAFLCYLSLLLDYCRVRVFQHDRNSAFERDVNFIMSSSLTAGFLLRASHIRI